MIFLTYRSPLCYDISCGTDLEMHHLHQQHTPARKALENLFRATKTYFEWVPEYGPDLIFDTGLNRQQSDRAIISPGRVHDFDGARSIVASFHHPAGLRADTVKPK